MKYTIYITHSGRAYSGPVLNPEAPHPHSPDDCHRFEQFDARIAWLRFVASYAGHGMVSLRQATRQAIRDNSMSAGHVCLALDRLPQTIPLNPKP